MEIIKIVASCLVVASAIIDLAYLSYKIVKSAKIAHFKRKAKKATEKGVEQLKEQLFEEWLLKKEKEHHEKNETK